MHHCRHHQFAGTLLLAVLVTFASSQSLPTNTSRLQTEFASKLDQLRNTSSAIEKWHEVADILTTYSIKVIDELLPVLSEVTFDANISTDCVQALLATAAAVKSQRNWSIRSE